MFKKIISIIICLTISLGTTVGAYALSADLSNDKSYMFDLKITSDESEIKLMRDFNKTLQCNYEGDVNSIKFNVTKGREKENIVYLSGEGIVTLNNKKMLFSFENQEFFSVKSKNQVLYDGSIEIVLTNIDGTMLECLMDITMKADYSDAVVSLTILNSSGNSKCILLYGETFESQILYTQNTAKAYQNQTESLQINNEVQTNESSRAASKFHHVMNVSNKKLDGVETEKQMIVMSIAKYDPRCKKEESGSELIRVFARSYNVVKIVDDAVQAIPYRVKATFACGKANNGNPFIEIDNTNPKNGSSSLPKYLSIFTPYIPDATASVIVNTILTFANPQTTSVKITDHLDTGAYTKASFNVLVYDSTNFDKPAAINLPSGTGSSDAEENKKNGIAFVVDYDENSLAPSSNGYANATCTATITYRAILGTANRFTSVTTGTPQYTHKLYGKNY